MHMVAVATNPSSSVILRRDCEAEAGEGVAVMVEVIVKE